MPTACRRFRRRCTQDSTRGHGTQRWTTRTTRFVAEIELVEGELPPTIDPDSSEADPYYAHLPLDAYAAQNDGEFFAVSSEAFFVEPARLQRAFPKWYAQLAAFFRQDPLARVVKRLLIVFHSMTGAAEQLAGAAAAGARDEPEVETRACRRGKRQRRRRARTRTATCLRRPRTWRRWQD